MNCVELNQFCTDSCCLWSKSKKISNLKDVFSALKMIKHLRDSAKSKFTINKTILGAIVWCYNQYSNNPTLPKYRRYTMTICSSKHPTQHCAAWNERIMSMHHCVSVKWPFVSCFPHEIVISSWQSEKVSIFLVFIL